MSWDWRTRDLFGIADTIGNPEEVAASMKDAGNVIFKISACEKLIISAINGVAVGAGLSSH